MKVISRIVAVTLLFTCFVVSGCSLYANKEEMVPSPPMVAPVPYPVAVADTPPPSPAPSMPSEAMLPMKDYGKIVTVWYGTNRKPSSPFNNKDPYGIERDSKLNYGNCQVRIPKSHVRGSLGSQIKYFFTGKDEPVEFLSASKLEELDYWRKLEKLLAELNQNERQVLVFIHGYNNSFNDAALRAAQIWADLELKGIPAFFSWPSRDATLNYTADEATIDASEVYLAQFLVGIRDKLRAEKINIIAHSMGNRALLRVVNQAVNEAQQKTGKPFCKIFLAAPDVDIDVFNQLAKAYPKIADKTTIYVSKEDVAVEMSKGVHQYPRVGAPPPFAIVPDIDTVEVRAPQGMLELGHSYFAEFFPVVEDIRSLILNDKPYSERKWDASAKVWVLEPSQAKQ